MHVGKQLQLATQRGRELAVSHDDRRLGRRYAPPDEPGERTEDNRREDGHRPGKQKLPVGRRFGRSQAGPWPSPGAEEVQDERHEDDAGGGPARKPWQLVDRQVAKRPMVAIVDAEQLREEDPEWNRHQGPSPSGHRGGGDRGGDDGRDEIGAREHSPAQHVPPPRPPGGRGDAPSPPVASFLRDTSDYRLRPGLLSHGRPLSDDTLLDSQ